MTTPPDVTASVLRRRAAEGALWLTATGSSMAPQIVAGDRIRLAVERRRPRIGEVWVFVAASGEVTAHRYLRRTRRRRLVFVGDRTPAADHPVREEWVIARVDAVERDGERCPVLRREGFVPVVRAIGAGARRRISAWLGRRLR